MKALSVLLLTVLSAFACFAPGGASRNVHVAELD